MTASLFGTCPDAPQVLKMNREDLSSIKSIFKEGRSRKADGLHACLQPYVAHTPSWEQVSRALRPFYMATQEEPEGNGF